jgi:hypothetical protein
MNTKEASESIGKILNEFLKSGPTSPAHIEEIREKILAIVHQIVESPQAATKDYAASCEEFFAAVKKVKGIPTQEIVGDGAGRGRLVSSSGTHIADSFTHLLPALTDSYNFCIENYREQSQVFFADQIDQFQDLLLTFLGQVPVGGTKDKAVKSKITEIKRELRALPDWSDLLSIYKQTSFSSEIEYIFQRQGGAIAAMWHYSPQDEEGEYKKTYDHRTQDKNTYAVRDNWAIAKGLMNAGPYGYLDDITRPAQEIGCCCEFRYVYHLRDLPEAMLTYAGQAELRRVKQAVEELLGERTTRDEQLRAPNIAMKPKGGLMSWFRRGKS